MASSDAGPVLDPTAAPVTYPQRQLGESIFIVAVVFTVISTCVLALRLWARLLTPKKGFGADDWIAVAAWPFVVGMGAETALLMRHGYGIHLMEVATTTPGNIVYGLQVLYAGYITYNFAICLVRISATLFYHRLFSVSGGVFKYYVWGAIGLNIAWLIGSQLAAILECSPVYAFWDRTAPGAQCLETLNLQLGSGITSVLLDFLALVMPMPIIWKLQLSPLKKSLLFLTFIIGYSVIVLSIGRLVTVAKLGDSLNTDITWSFPDVLIWLILETSIASICVSLPSTFTLFQRVKNGGLAALFTRREIASRTVMTDYGSNGGKSGRRKGFKMLTHSQSDGTDDNIPLDSRNEEGNHINVTTDVTVSSSMTDVESGVFHAKQ